jgi:hypothetical protein
MSVDGQGERRVEGRLVTLVVGDAGSRVWLGPGWAILCGAVASGGLSIQWRTPVVLLLGVLLVDSVLGSMWTLAGLDGRAPRRKKKGNPGGQSGELAGPRGSPGSALLRVVDSSKLRLARWASRIWPRARGSILGWGFLSLLAVLISSVLGSMPLGLTVVALGLAAWRLAMAPGEGALSSVLASCYLAGLPWLMGWAAFSDLQFGMNGLRPLSQALVWAAAYSMTFHAFRLLGGQRLARGSKLLAAAHVSAIVLLVVARKPVLAGGVALLLLPQLMLQPALLSVGEGVWYLRRVQIFTMLATMVTAMAMMA